MQKQILNVSQKENITYYLDLYKSTGFNKIVVDVRPVQGDALFKSSYLTPLTDLTGTHIERDWNYLQFFIDEAHKRELEVTVPATIFTAGLPSSKNGMAYRDDTWDGKNLFGIYQRSGFDRY
ncbi:family 10 glycosylhydrolase [Bacteroides ovatus]|nr:family 10 glycosylhydrolase [Bacteroides ovatus]